MRKPLMPKATASWLIENTTLSFEQIGNFVGLHILEIQAIADGEVSSGILPRNPIENGELSKDEISKCEKNQNATFEGVKPIVPRFFRIGFSSSTSEPMIQLELSLRVMIRPSLSSSGVVRRGYRMYNDGIRMRRDKL